MAHRKISSLALYVDTRREAPIAAAKTIAGIAEKNGVGLLLPPQQAKALHLNGGNAAGSFPQSADLLVSLGGDGTLLRAAHLAGPLGIPIVGVDFGRVGFLAAVGPQEYGATITALLQHGIETEPRLALQAQVAGSERSYYAVNDVHIDRKHHGKIIHFDIHIGGEAIATIPADGIIVASPTGSTAYFLSAGGPIMSPTLQAVGITPICPHTLFSRPLIVSADETIEISLPRESSGTQLFVDGHPEEELAAGTSVKIVRAQKPVEFVRLNERYFFQTLERKLHWGTSLKRSLEREPNAT
ncbi:MAG TPA: NAD(+)/NADH kinase [Candidatus Eremiobacteraceae bacterium]|nr:NAD(+)/NADH kinase [Candidatus Eremiobacteraceae bacterium]